MKRPRIEVLSLALTGLLAAACGGPGAAASANAPIVPKYDEAGRLTLLTFDRDANGKVDTWGYMDGARVVRVEVDEDGDGKADRWEYHSGAECEGAGCVGQASAAPGQPAAGTAGAPDTTIARIERATRHDGRVSRREFFEKGALTRIEEDTDGDGHIDKWETYSGGTLSILALDSQGRDRPDRRLIYGPDGTLLRIEADPTGSGKFEALRQ